MPTHRSPIKTRSHSIGGDSLAHNRDNIQSRQEVDDTMSETETDNEIHIAGTSRQNESRDETELEKMKRMIDRLTNTVERLERENRELKNRPLMFEERSSVRSARNDESRIFRNNNNNHVDVRENVNTNHGDSRDINRENNRVSEQLEVVPQQQVVMPIKLPRGGWLVSPFQNLKFDGREETLNPVIFVKRFEKIVERERVESLDLLSHFASCMCEGAANWFDTHDFEGYEQAKRKFLNRYWSETVQSKIKRHIYTGKYDTNKNTTMSEYAAEIIRLGKILDNPMSEQELINNISRHFDESVANLIRPGVIDNTEQMMSLLNHIDIERKIKMQERNANGDKSKENLKKRNKLSPYNRLNDRINDNNRKLERKDYYANYGNYKNYYRDNSRKFYSGYKYDKNKLNRETENKRERMESRYKERKNPVVTFPKSSSDENNKMNENSTRRKDKFSKTENIKSTSKTRNQSHAKVLAVKDKFYRENFDISSESLMSSGEDNNAKFRRKVLVMETNANISSSTENRETCVSVKTPNQFEVDKQPEIQKRSLDINKEKNVSIEHVKVNDNQFVANRFHESFKGEKRPLGLIRVKNIIKDLDEFTRKEQTMRVKRNNAFVKIKIGDIDTKALIDTGAQINTLSKEFCDKLIASGIKVNIIPIKKFSLRGAFDEKGAHATHKATFDLGINGNNFSAEFYVMKIVIYPVILGLEFLSRYQALIKCNSDHLEIELVENNDPIIGVIESLTREEAESKFKEIIEINKDLFTEEIGCANNYVHKIEMLNTTPFKKHPYPIPDVHKKRVLEHLQELEKKGIIEKKATSYVNPLVVVTKTNGDIRICLDARELNKRMKGDHAQPPTIDEIFRRIGNKKYFSTLDINKAFWQIPLTKDSCQYTGFLAGNQTYVFKRLPFGLKTSGASFVRAMSKTLNEVDMEYVTVYLDDILIASNSREEHLTHLSTVFQKLREAGYTVNLDKCELFKKEINFLGHTYTRIKAAINEKTKLTIQNFPRPRNKKDVQRFLGAVNWDRRFIKNLSRLTKSLENLLKKNVKFQWTDIEQEAFNAIKLAFKEAPDLFLLREDLKFGIYIDASTSGLGAKLYQYSSENPESKYTIAYASRSLKGAELNYTITELECLALVWCLRKWYNILIGRHIKVHTDHRALQFLSTCTQNSARIARWFGFINEFDLQIEHIPGKENTIADMLSRSYEEYGVKRRQDTSKYVAIIKNPEDGDDTTPWVELIREAQQNDESLKNRCDKNPNKYLVRDGIIRVKINEIERIMVPKAISWDLLYLMHRHILHFGTEKLIAFAKQYFIISNLDAIARDVVSSCCVCIATKYYTGATVGVHYYDQAREPNETVSLDIYGPLPTTSRGNKYVIVLIDHFSKLTKFYPVRNQKLDVILNVIEKKYIPEIGIPAEMLTDCGGQFISERWLKFAERHDFAVRHTSPYNPQSNPVERVMRELGRIIRAYSHGKHTVWDRILNRAERIINTTEHSSTGYKPVEFHVNIKYQDLLHEDLIPLMAEEEDIRRKVERAQITLQEKLSKRQRQSAKKEVAPEYSVGSKVWVRIHKQSKKDKRQTKKIFMLYDGPYVIKELVKPNVYLIADQEGEVVGVYNCRQLRPHREPLLRNVPDRREASSESVDDAVSQDSDEIKDSSESELSKDAEPIRYQLRSRRLPRYKDDSTRIVEEDSRKRSVGDRRKRRWYDGKFNQGNRLPVIRPREELSDNPETSGKRMRLQNARSEESSYQTDSDTEHCINNCNMKYSYNKRYVDTSNSDLDDTTESEYSYDHANIESSDESMLELCMMMVEDSEDSNEDDEEDDEGDDMRVELLPETKSDGRIHNGGVQQQKKLYQESKDKEGSRISISSSRLGDSKGVYTGPGYLQALNVITKVIKRPVMQNTIFGIACDVYVDMSSETNFVSDHFLNGVITGAYSPFISIHKLIDKGHSYAPAKYYTKCKSQLNNLCNDYTFVVLNIPTVNAIIVSMNIVSYMQRSRILVSDVAGLTVTSFFRNSNSCYWHKMSSGDERFEKQVKEWEEIEQEKNKLNKVKRIQDDRLKEFGEIMEKRRRENIVMRKQLKRRDEILKRMGLKPVLPDIEIEKSAEKQSQKESHTEYSNKKVAIKKIPTKAVHIIPKKKVDVKGDSNRIELKESKREEVQSQWQKFKKTLGTTAAKTIKKGNISPKFKIRQKIRERKYRKYFFNEDSEEEISSSDGEKPRNKGEPKIMSIQNVQIKLPRLTNKEIEEVIRSKPRQPEKAEDVEESVRKVRQEIDQLRKNMEGTSNENGDQLQYGIIEEQTDGIFEEIVHLDAIPLPGETLPDQIMEPMQIEVVPNFADEIPETLALIDDDEKMSQQGDKELGNNGESLEKPVDEEGQQSHICHEGMIEREDLSNIGGQMEKSSSKEIPENNLQADNEQEQQVI